jgi:hypothetical protein
VAKAALATAIPAAALAGLDLLNDRRGYGGGRHEHEGDRAVNRYELGLVREIGAKSEENAMLKAERYTDHAIGCAVEKLEAKIEKAADKAEAATNFINEKFTKGYGELAAKYGELCGEIAMESERRKCGDKELFTYIDGNYIKADKRLSHRHIDHELPCPGRSYREPCGGKQRGKGGVLADLIEDGSITGTITLGAATSE